MFEIKLFQVYPFTTRLKIEGRKKRGNQLILWCDSICTFHLQAVNLEFQIVDALSNGPSTKSMVFNV